MGSFHHPLDDRPKEPKYSLIVMKEMAYTISIDQLTSGVGVLTVRVKDLVLCSTLLDDVQRFRGSCSESDMGRLERKLCFGILMVSLIVLLL